MQFPNTGYMWQPTEAQWDTMLRGLPRANLEALLYDLAWSSGVLHGLEVEPSAPANLTVNVRRGRSLYRNDGNRRGEVAELEADLALDMAPYRPLAGTQAVYVVARRLVVDAGPSVLVENAPVGHPDRDPLFAAYNLNTSEKDWIEVLVVSAPALGQAVLAVVALSAGQTAVEAQHLSTAARQEASGRGATAALRARLEAVEGLLESLDIEGGTVAEARQAQKVPWTGVEGRPGGFGVPVYNSTPPIEAVLGSIWENGPFTLVKVAQPNANQAIWRTQQAWILGLRTEDYLGNPESTYRFVAMPNLVAGLEVVQGDVICINCEPGYSRVGSGGTPGPFCEVWWKVPADAIEGSNGNPNQGQSVFVFLPENLQGGGDQIYGEMVYPGGAILPGERLWLKIGNGGSGRPTGIISLSAQAHLSLRLRQNG